VLGHVTEHGLGLVELALALEVERKVVKIVHQAVGQWHLAKLVPSHVELALTLIGQAKHTIRFGGAFIRLDLGALGHDEALGDQRHVTRSGAGHREPSAGSRSPAW
jgi:hypothetical protein